MGTEPISCVVFSSKRRIPRQSLSELKGTNKRQQRIVAKGLSRIKINHVYGYVYDFMFMFMSMSNNLKKKKTFLRRL